MVLHEDIEKVEPVAVAASRVNSLVAQAAVQLRGLTNGAGIKPADLSLHGLAFDKRIADLKASLNPVNVKTGIFEAIISGSASQDGVPGTPPKAWPVLMVAGSLGGELPSLPNGNSSQVILEDLIAEHTRRDQSFVSYVVLTDAVQPKRYAAGSFLTVPVITVNSGGRKETPYQFKLH